MRAFAYTKYGSPKQLSLQDTPQPQPSQNEVLIAVKACTVNRTDCAFLRGKPFITRLFSGVLAPKSKTLGNEFAGEIIEVGENVSNLKVGDRVFGYNDISFGAQAEFIVAQSNGPIAIIPEDMSYKQVAPALEGAHYALCNIRAAKIEKGQHALVYGATGAIGSAAVQLLKHYGAAVTAVCDTKHLDLIKSLGADSVIDYQLTDFTKMNYTFDFIFDAVGKSSFAACKKILNPNGLYVSTELGWMWQNIFLALSTPILKGKKVLFPIPTITQDDVILFQELMQKEKYLPVIDRIFNFEKLVDAYNYVETGKKIGNVVITLEPKQTN